MAEQEVKRVDTETPGAPAPVESKSEVADEKAIVPPPPASEEKEKVADESKDLAVAENVALADLEKEKRLSFVKAWEDSERTKAENKSQKKLSAVVAWENSKKAALEATLRKMEEKLEKQRAEYAEKMRNKVALIHKEAEEKRAMIESKRGEEFLKAEEMAAKYRATGQTPKKFLGFF